MNISYIIGKRDGGFAYNFVNPYTPHHTKVEALVEACRLNIPHIVQKILNHGVDPHEKNLQGVSPFEAASIHPDGRCTEILLSA